MSAIFVRPLPFTATETSPLPLGGSVANLNNDKPNMVWRFGLDAPYLIIDLGSTARSYNYVALLGANLRASDTVRIRTGTGTTGTGSFDGTARAAYVGEKDEETTTKAIYPLPATRGERFVRIDLAAPSHPDGFVEFSRLVVGMSVEGEGIELGAEQSFETQSVIATGPGFRNTDVYESLDAWKVSTPWIKAADWRTTWAPFLRYASRGHGVLFIADDTTPATWQNEAIFGFLTNTATGKWDNANLVRFETKLIAYSR